VRTRVPPGATRVDSRTARASCARDIDDAAPARTTTTRRAEATRTESGNSASSRLDPTRTGFTFDDRDEDYPETWLESTPAASRG
jgi:hypothetical protein